MRTLAQSRPGRVAGRMLLSVVACLGFVLHQVCVPLHLSLHHHHSHEVAELHVDPPAGHDHHGGDHVPHPVADHDGDHGDRALRPAQGFVLPCAASAGPVALVFDAPASLASRRPDPVPPPSAPRSTARARAPPVAV